MADRPVRPRVFLVDDHELIRSGIRAELADRVEVVGEADEVDAAIAMILERRPDVVLVDVHLPGGGGRAVVEAVRAAGGSAAFLALSVSDAPEDVIALIRAGARGYVTKSIAGADLATAVEAVAEGEVVFSPRLAGFVLDAFRDLPAGTTPDPELDQLTPRERQVLRLIARGFTYRDVGIELGVAVKTVESHVSAVLRKLQLSSRHELTHWAHERRLL